MGDKITFDYFYGGQEETFSYYRIPRVLFTGQQFKGLSIGAKMRQNALRPAVGPDVPVLPQRLV